MILNRKQIKQLAQMAGFEVQDVSGGAEDEEMQLFNGNLVDPDSGTVFNGIIACSLDYPEDLTDILEP